MNQNSLQDYLHDHIPVTRAMQVGVVEITDSSLTLSAPIAANINHRETVFGGSASALCILSAWSLIHCRLTQYSQFTPRIVIQRNSMEYTKPVLADFTAICQLDRPETWDRLIKSLTRKSIGRIQLTSSLMCEGQTAGRFEGSFVVSDMTDSNRTESNKAKSP